ncbi:MAG: metalloregulator ArsR/SmtB family transcription factor [Candidatus Moranbacteria bacterium]|nr:metalloregulator ArsR/SmtB family transcription factor [Candidatus Moranbacteria bacterium]
MKSIDKKNEKLDEIFKALADKNRLKILLFIHKQECRCRKNELSCQNEACIKDLAGLLGVTMPTISHHIKELVNAHLITTKKEGRWVYCKINKESFKEVSDFFNGLTI